MKQSQWGSNSNFLITRRMRIQLSHRDQLDKKYTGCNLETIELLDCALIGVYAVIKYREGPNQIRS